MTILSSHDVTHAVLRYMRCAAALLLLRRQAGRQAGSQAGRQTGRQAGRQAGSQAASQPARQAARQPGSQAARQPAIQPQRSREAVSTPNFLGTSTKAFRVLFMESDVSSFFFDFRGLSTISIHVGCPWSCFSRISFSEQSCEEYVQQPARASATIQ